MRDTKQEKGELRRLLSAKRRDIPLERRKYLDAKLSNKILSLACYRFADTLLMFYPIGSEPDLLEVARAALAGGRRLAFPVCDKESSTMTFRYVSSLDELRTGSYAIPEPPKDNPEYGGEDATLCIVPALSFDKDGYRLGYGGGYYDRFLKNFKGTSVGALYSELLADELPRGYYDVPVSLLITEKRSIIANESSEKKYKSAKK